MNLQHITFTGVDERTSIKELQEIQQEFPIAEFGVLSSYKYAENDNRYPSPDFIESLRGCNLNLALHICGRAAHDVTFKDGWDIYEQTLGKEILSLFKRVQLNLANRKNNPSYCWIPVIIGQELIIQSKDSDHIDLWQSTLDHWSSNLYPHRDVISTLIDPSGGRGKFSTWKPIKTNHKVGYAGGINPENFSDVLSFLSSEVSSPFWVDMESGVRTNDWLDLNKVHKVLSIYKSFLRY